VHKKTFLLHDDIRLHYRFDPKIIGHGHFGNVRLAKLCNQPSSTKTFAVKTLSKEKLGNEIHLIKRELDILTGIDHPNIVRFYNCYEDEKFFHIVMEHCSGGELLDKLLGHGHIDEAECAVIFSKLLAAVKYLHEHGVVHRDLKPENLLFSDKTIEAEIKLIDFGLSRKVGDSKNMQSIVGTPLYVAPEVLKGSYDQRCDYWSIGALLYLMLGGSPPFDGETRKEIFANILKGEFSFEGPQWKKVSSKAKDLISKLLVVDVNNRYDAIKALNHPWFKQTLNTSISSETRLEVMSNLKTFTKSRRFRKEALNVVVSYLSDQEIKQLREAFRSYDKEKTGEITIQDLKITLKELGFKCSREEIQQLIDDINIDHSDTIKYSEFLAAAMNAKSYLTKEKLWITFKHFDTDDSNYITPRDIKTAMIKCGKEVTDEEAELMIKDGDYYKDGRVSFAEFCLMMLDGSDVQNNTSSSCQAKP